MHPIVELLGGRCAARQTLQLHPAQLCQVGQAVHSAHELPEVAVRDALQRNPECAVRVCSTSQVARTECIDFSTEKMEKRGRAAAKDADPEKTA